MTKLQKYLLSYLGAGLLGVLIVFFIIDAQQKITNPPYSTNTVFFTGEGKVLAKPDIAITSITIVTEKPTSGEAQDENSKKSRAIVDFLKKQKIDPKDIRTISYNIFPQYKYPQFESPAISGYQVNESIEIKIRDLAKVSDIIKGLVSAGANQVNQVSFQIDDPDKLRAGARAKAIEDAKQKASELEDQLGINLGKIINFSENSGNLPLPIAYSNYDKGGGYGGGGPSLPTGENEINVSVTITYQIR